MRLIDLDDSAHTYHGGMEMWSVDTEKTIDAIPITFIDSIYKELLKKRDSEMYGSEQWKILDLRMMGIEEIRDRWAERKEE